MRNQDPRQACPDVLKIDSWPVLPLSRLDPTFAEFEVDLLRMRTREGMAVARAKGKLKGKKPKLTPRQQDELGRMHASGEYTIADLAELFSVSRPTVYRVLERHQSAPAPSPSVGQ
ncbi:recombinase family protein [Nonomuraea sp. NPDC049269]|uniref:helix-turn-helix domain-containing protein n=1 Tax=Nonomuraea sp. NPDC049269 TaxID=3364349 RepID=UPI0037117754